MFINWKMREVKLKIVYYGASLCGKTTNLEFIHANVNPAARSDLVSLKTREDRTIFFDFLEIQLGEVKGLTYNWNMAGFHRNMVDVTYTAGLAYRFGL